MRRIIFILAIVLSLVPISTHYAQEAQVKPSSPVSEDIPSLFPQIKPIFDYVEKLVKDFGVEEDLYLHEINKEMDFFQNKGFSLLHWLAALMGYKVSKKENIKKERKFLKYLVTKGIKNRSYSLFRTKLSINKTTSADLTPLHMFMLFAFWGKSDEEVMRKASEVMNVFSDLKAGFLKDMLGNTPSDYAGIFQKASLEEKFSLFNQLLWSQKPTRWLSKKKMIAGTVIALFLFEEYKYGLVRESIQEKILRVAGRR